MGDRIHRFDLDKVYVMVRNSTVTGGDGSITIVNSNSDRLTIHRIVGTFFIADRNRGAASQHEALAAISLHLKSDVPVSKFFGIRNSFLDWAGFRGDVLGLARSIQNALDPDRHFPIEAKRTPLSLRIWAALFH